MNGAFGSSVIGAKCWVQKHKIRKDSPNNYVKKAFWARESVTDKKIVPIRFVLNCLLFVF